MPYLSIFRLTIENTIAMFEFVLMQSLVQKYESLNFRPTMSYYGILGLEFKKKYCDIWNQSPQICLITKFFERMKMPEVA